MYLWTTLDDDLILHGTHADTVIVPSETLKQVAGGMIVIIWNMEYGIWNMEYTVYCC